MYLNVKMAISLTLTPNDGFLPNTLVSLRSDNGEILRQQTWSRGLGVRLPSQWHEK